MNSFEHVINSTETNTELTPNCLFIKALEYYIEQQYDSTLDLLFRVVERQDASVDLKIRSWYWIGYEQNNMCKFTRAINSFNTAIALAKATQQPGERLAELERLKIESMLYDSPERASKFLDNIDRVVKRCQQEDYQTDTIEKCILTHGNLLFASAMQAYKKDRSDEAVCYLRRAQEILLPLKDAGNKIAKREWWLICLMLNEARGKEEQVKIELENSVIPEMRKEMADRVGPRPKATFSLLQLMLYKALGNYNEVAIQRTEITQYIGDVHEDAGVYSPLEKRIMERSEFLDHVQKIVRHGLPHFDVKIQANCEKQEK